VESRVFIDETNLYRYWDAVLVAVCTYMYIDVANMYMYMYIDVAKILMHVL
jgi:hypothetical protein